MRRMTAPQTLPRAPRKRGLAADRIEGLVVRDDLQDVPRSRIPEPYPRRDRDAQVAPVLDPERRGAVDESCAVSREQASRVEPDHAPVADRHELRLSTQLAQLEVLKHAGDVLGAARVLDVEEHGAPRAG